MESNIKIGQVYKHFKGKYYIVVGIATDCEDIDQRVVIYRALYDDCTTWARNYEEFVGMVDKSKYPECTQTYRFEKVDINTQALQEILALQETIIRGEIGRLNEALNPTPLFVD